MRSCSKRKFANVLLRSRGTVCALVAAACLSSSTVFAIAQEVSTTGAETPSQIEVQQVVAALKQDPNLTMERKIRSLKWARQSSRQSNSMQLGWLGWLTGFFEWLAQSSRIVLWSAIVVLVGLIVVFLLRVVRKFETPVVTDQQKLPTHVRELDIRPESLPEDIGAAAWQRWQRGEHRNALSLLYRGLLSRLVHQHAVPIRDSSTEAECLALAKPRLDAKGAAYSLQLLNVWQRVVYGAQAATDDELRTLCDEFNNALRAPARLPVERAA